MNEVEVHILPCLVNFSGKTEFKKLFKDKIRNLSDETPEDIIPGGYNITEVCGEWAKEAGFSVKVTEKYLKDLYYPLKGSDLLLRGKYYVFFRGRQLRGAELALEDLGYEMAVFTPERGHKSSELTKASSAESKVLTKRAKISSLTLWELEDDVSPLSPNVAAYRYLALSKAISDYQGEEEYFKRLNSDS